MISANSTDNKPKKVKRYLHTITELIRFLKEEEDVVFIQPHNYADHDAIASAFSLQALFNHYEINSKIVYDKEIERESLKNFVKKLEIKIKHIDDCEMKEYHKIVLVDGCKGNYNVTDLIGDEVGVIDHHRVSSPDDVEFSDIRQEYGACATIIADYFVELGVPIPKDVATAIMIGINFDTSNLTRRVSNKDIEIYNLCYHIADVDYVNSVLRNYIHIPDLKYYEYLLQNVKYKSRVAFCYFPAGCSQNLLGLLSDFVLALAEIDFVVLCAKKEDVIIFSLRNENYDWNAAKMINKILKGRGSGGGHVELAGGTMIDISTFDENKILEQVVSILESRVHLCEDNK